MRHASNRIRHCLAMAAVAVLCSTGAQVAAADKGYAVGDRLQAGTVKRSQPAGTPYRLISWDDLMPAGWDPMKGLELPPLASLGDSDPRAQAALQKLRQLWDSAPVRPELQGAQVRLPGFVVPLDGQGNSIREFLLVPYFGACIHTPPPPSNQVVHVVLDRPAQGVRMMDPVWVFGELQVASSATGLGHAGYKMQGRQVLPYKE